MSRDWPMLTVCRPEICTTQINVFLLYYYCTLLYFKHIKSSHYMSIRHTVAVLPYSPFWWTLLFFMCRQSCAFAYIISPTFWWLRHGFLNSPSALLLAHCILHGH